RSSSAKGAIARRASPASSWSTSRRRVLSLWTMRAPSGAGMRNSGLREDGDDDDGGDREEGEEGQYAADDPADPRHPGSALRVAGLLRDAEDAEDQARDPDVAAVTRHRRDAGEDGEDDGRGVRRCRRRVGVRRWQ